MEEFLIPMLLLSLGTYLRVNKAHLGFIENWKEALKQPRLKTEHI